MKTSHKLFRRYLTLQTKIKKLRTRLRGAFTGECRGGGPDPYPKKICALIFKQQKKFF